MHYLILALLYMAAIFYASTLPGHQVAKLTPFDLPDYVMHGAAFAGLAVIWYLALTRSLKVGTVKAQLIALLIAAAYGLTDEYHQSFVSGRDPSARDLLADVVGAGLALLFTGWVTRRRGVRPANRVG